MYLWKIEYNIPTLTVKWLDVVNCFKVCIFERLNTILAAGITPAAALWIALNYVSLKDWIQSSGLSKALVKVVNCFKLCIFERLNTMKQHRGLRRLLLWIALNYVSLKDWIQLKALNKELEVVVNCFKLCIFERLNTISIHPI